MRDGPFRESDDCRALVALQYVNSYDAWRAAHDLYWSTNSLFIYVSANFGMTELAMELCCDLSDLRGRLCRLHRALLRQAALVERWELDD